MTMMKQLSLIIRLFTLANQEEREYVVKFMFRLPTKKDANSEVVLTHFSVLKNVKDNYPSLTIYDN